MRSFVCLQTTDMDRCGRIKPGVSLAWLTYGAGHVHGVMLDGVTIANFERDDAHRETQRELGNGLTQTTHYDEAGRLARQLLQGTRPRFRTCGAARSSTHTIRLGG